MNKQLRTARSSVYAASVRRALLSTAAVATVVSSASAVYAQNADTTLERVSPASVVPQPGPGGAPIHWAVSPITIELDATVTSLTPKARNAIRKAFDAWSAPKAKNLPSTRFVDSTAAIVPNARDRHNTIIVAAIDDPKFKYAAALTTFYVNSAGEIVEADMVLNADFAFGVVDHVALGESVGTTESAIVTEPDVVGGVTCSLPSVGSGACGGIYDIENIVTHEAGHFFGLPDDFNDPSSTMYFCARRCEVAKRMVSEVDSDAIEVGYRDVVYAAPHEDGSAGLTVVPEAARPASCQVAGSVGSVGKDRGLLAALLPLLVAISARACRRPTGSRASGATIPFGA